MRLRSQGEAWSSGSSFILGVLAGSSDPPSPAWAPGREQGCAPTDPCRGPVMPLCKCGPEACPGYQTGGLVAAAGLGGRGQGGGTLGSARPVLELWWFCPFTCDLGAHSSIRFLLRQKISAGSGRPHLERKRASFTMSGRWIQKEASREWEGTCWRNTKRHGAERQCPFVRRVRLCRNQLQPPSKYHSWEAFTGGRKAFSLRCNSCEHGPHCGADVSATAVALPAGLMGSVSGCHSVSCNVSYRGIFLAVKEKIKRKSRVWLETNKKS